MKEPRKKGLASHLDPESCATSREVGGEALTGAHPGQPSSSEITLIGVPTSFPEGEGHRQGGVQREPSGHAAESETLCTWGHSLRENRETPGTPPTGTGGGRREKAVWPYVPHVRSWGVGRSHSTDDAGEQGRPAGDGGVCRGKGIEQGDGPVRRPRPGHSAGTGGSLRRRDHGSLALPASTSDPS
jgi:hypothetical protein